MPFWFKKRKADTKPPLFEMPDPTKPIEFDDEEEFIVDTESTGGNAQFWRNIRCDNNQDTPNVYIG